MPLTIEIASVSFDGFLYRLLYLGLDADVDLEANRFAVVLLDFFPHRMCPGLVYVGDHDRRAF